MKLELDLKTRNSYSYSSYGDMIDSLLAKSKTTGDNHSEDMIGYTTMNVTRMNRINKKASINEELSVAIKALPPQKWLVISEAWCGDAAQNLPWLNKMAELNDNIELSIILRDENTDVIDQFLTNGGRSIPKLIATNQENDILFDWGPRPTVLQDLYVAKKNEGLVYEDISKIIHTWYARDKGHHIQEEIFKLIS